MRPSTAVLPLLCALSFLVHGARAQPCISFGSFRTVGNLPGNLKPAGTLHEVSGIEASRMNPGVLWVHDDGGSGNQIVAIDQTGRVIQQYELGGVSNGDWEDLAIGPGPIPGRDYIYIGEIGNNNLSFTAFSLIRFPEPITPPTPGSVVRIQNVEIFAFRYPSRTHDAETLLIDPVDGRPYIVTKEPKSTGTGYVYGYPMPLDATNIKTMTLERTFPHPDPRFAGGDVSVDGRWIILRNNDDVYAYERGAPGNRFADAFAVLRCRYGAKGQGNAEAITISPDGTRLWAASEAQGAGIFEASGSLPAGTIAMPSWWLFGSDSRSWLWGSAGLTLSAVPALGRPISAVLWDGRPNAPAAVGFDTVAVPDGVIRLAGGWAHVVPSLVVTRVTDGRGVAHVSLGTPQSTALLGVKVHAQAVVQDVASSYGLTLTRGLTLQVGR